MSKHILLISHNFSPEPTGIGKYNGEMIDWLIKNGFNCTVLTTFPYYPYWKVQPPYKNRWFKKEVTVNQENNAVLTVYRCPSYVPADPTGKKRIIQDISFWSSMLWIILKFVIRRKKFDFIITVAPPFHLAYLGLAIRKSTGGKLLYHVQDLQIEAAQSLNMLSNQKIFDRIYKIEKSIMNKADYLSSISDGMIKKIKEKANQDVYFFPNWVDTSVFFPIDDRASLKNKWNFKDDDMIFLYSGAIGEKQGLDSILLAAKQLINNTNIKFVIGGSGPYKEKLVEITEKEGLTNVVFFPVQDKEVFNMFLNMADVHMILQKANASDLVMPSKLTTILAIGGVSIVTSPVGTTLYNVFEQNDMGYLIEPENTELLVKTISEIKIDDEYRQKQKASREYAIKYLSIDNIMKTFAKNFITDN
jgi:colanic acid biosynthesis glycosyl transferase WcaI